MELDVWSISIDSYPDTKGLPFVLLFSTRRTSIPKKIHTTFKISHHQITSSITTRKHLNIYHQTKSHPTIFSLKNIYSRMSTEDMTQPASMNTSSTPRSAATATANTSTSSLTLVETLPQQGFSAPPRIGTDSSLTSTSSTSTTTSQNVQPQRHNSTSRAQFQATISRARESRERRSEERVSDRQAELLRYKGTYTDSGRHSDDWLFGGWSFKDSVKGAWRWANSNHGRE